MRRIDGTSIYAHMNDKPVRMQPITMPDLVQMVMNENYGEQRFLCLLVAARRKKEAAYFAKYDAVDPTCFFTDALDRALNQHDAY